MESESGLQRILDRIKRNPLIVALIFLAGVVIGVSSFTNATKDLIGMVPKSAGPDVSGEWRADDVYDWPNANYTEKFHSAKTAPISAEPRRFSAGTGEFSTAAFGKESWPL